MLDFTNIKIGSPIKAQDIAALRQAVQEQGLRANEYRVPEQTQMPCVLDQDVPMFGFARITSGSFLDENSAWIYVGAERHNWVMFLSDYAAGTTGVCEVIPYHRPVMLRTGGMPMNGRRYDLGTMQEDEGGEFTCVGVTKDPAVFWYVRNAGVGSGGGTAELFAIVMNEVIATPEDWDYNTNQLPPTGRIKIYGKNYAPDPVTGEITYDLCTADFLSDYCNEIIPINTSIGIHGPYIALDSNNVPVQCYVAKRTEGVYVGQTSNAIQGPNQATTISIDNGTGSHVLINITLPVIGPSTTFPANEKVWVRRDWGVNGEQLFIFRARCL
jgi:hypothetical protein